MRPSSWRVIGITLARTPQPHAVGSAGTRWAVRVEPGRARRDQNCARELLPASHEGTLPFAKPSRLSRRRERVATDSHCARGRQPDDAFPQATRGSRRGSPSHVSSRANVPRRSRASALLRKAAEALGKGASLWDAGREVPRPQFLITAARTARTRTANDFLHVPPRAADACVRA